MFKLKHDIQIHLKKEVIQFVQLFVFTFFLSMICLGLPDYIWNITLYRIAIIMVVWVVAIPAIVTCRKKNITVQELIGEKVVRSIFFGILSGTVMGIIHVKISEIVKPGMMPLVNVNNVHSVVYWFIFYFFGVAVTEELIYRVAFIRTIREICFNNKFVAVILSDILFACAHLFQSTFQNAVITLFTGLIFSVLYLWKKGGFITAVVAHGLYDFLIMILPYLT